MIAVALILVVCPVIHAQRIGVTYDSAAQTKAALNNLSPGAQAVMSRLSNIGTMPLEAFRYSSGPVANGADTSLSDSSWQSVTLPFTASADEIWLRAWIEIPKNVNGYDLTGTKISLLGPTREDVTYFANGRRIASGPDMESTTLFDPAKPGDKVLLAMRIGKTANPKRLRPVRLRITFSPNRPNPEDLYTEFLSAALLVPSLTGNSTSAKSQLEQAILSVDLKALDAGNREAFDASLRQAKASLDGLGNVLHSATFHLTGNSHIDAAWLWPWTETVDVVKRTYGTAAQLMNEYPTYSFTQSAAQYNVWLADM